MRILLITPKNNYPDRAPSLDHMAQGVPYLAGTLKANGHEVFGLNLNYLRCPISAPMTLKKELKKRIAEYDPQLVGVSGLSADYLFVRDTIRFSQKIAPHTPIVCGGGIISSDVEYIFPLLHPDFAVIGEGEEAVLELTKCIEEGSDPGSVNGIAYWNRGKPVYTEERKQFADPDSLPFPDYTPFDVESYMSMVNQMDNYFHCRTRRNPRLFPVSAARSCPFQCTFCWHSTGRVYRKRSIDSVIDEIIHFHDIYHFNILKLYDELFSIKEDRVRYFCQRLNDLQLDIDWTCTLRVSDADNLDMLHEMKNAGCIHVGYGFESASPVVLQSIKKKVTVKQIQRAIELTEKAGIGVQGNFIFGDMAETPETIQQTIDFYDKYCRNHIVHLDYITPYPGSPIFHYCFDHGIISDKKQYYNTIHMRPILNMTKMTYKVFHDLIEPVVRNKFLGFTSVTNVSFEMVVSSGEERDSSQPNGRKTYSIAADCPHCDKRVNYLFPMEHELDTMEGWLNAITPLVSFCAKCHKRFVIPMLEIAGMKENYERYLGEIKSLLLTNKSVVITPVIDHSTMDIHNYYGLCYGQLNVVCFMDNIPWPEGTRFLSFPVVMCNSSEIRVRSDMEFIVLPSSNQRDIIEKLRENGVSDNRIHYLKIDLMVSSLKEMRRVVRKRVIKSIKGFLKV